MSEPTNTPQPANTEAPQDFGSIVKRLGPASILAAATLCLPPIGLVVLTWYLESIGSWLQHHGTQGKVIYVAAFIIFSGLALVPTHISAIVGGWAFGFIGGTPLALAGFLGGSLVSYAIARPTASQRVESLIAQKPKWKAVHDTLVRGSPWRVLAVVILIRVPATAFAATNLVLASVRVPVHLYALGTLIGMVPRTLIVTYVASRARSLAEADKTPWWAWVIGGVLTVTVLAVLGFIANKAVRKVTASAA